MGRRVKKKNLNLFYCKDKQWSLTKEFLKKLVNLFNVTVFVESGTLTGGTVKNAVPFFNEIHTVELSKELYKKAKKRFEQYEKVHVYNGDTSKLFYKILPTLNGKILFWLDGHYSEGTTAKGEKNTPIIEELISIKECGITDSIILIDDIRCFQPVENKQKNKSLTGYPTVQKLKKCILEINKNYNFKIFGDIAIAYNKSEPVKTSKVVDACTISREYETNKIFPEKIIQVNKTIALSNGIERETIENLHTLFQVHAQRHGLCKHYYLWAALLAAEEKKLEDSTNIFETAINLGLCPQQQKLFEKTIQSFSQD